VQGRSIDRRKIGQGAEDIAARFLEAQGAELLLRNYRRRLGELDLVARHGDVLLIVEVRTRATNRYGGAAESIDFYKRRRIIRASRQLLQQRRDLAQLRARFDVIVVFEPDGSNPQVDWIKHAFEA
jgi:putative endonuclease